MPFNNDIAGGNGALVRNWIQSDNYVAGSTGWRISKNGNAEFNNGTFRGSIEVGSLTGQHFWVNNPNTTDVIDVYNSANKLVFSIDNTGRLVSTSSVSTANVVIAGANLRFEDTAQSPIFDTLINGTVTANNTAVNINGGIPQNYVGTGQGAFISVKTGVNNASEVISAEQRGVQGTLVQTADTGQFVHNAKISCTTNAGGDGTSNHGCGFTPLGITGTCAPTSFTQQGVTVMIWQDLITATQFSFRILTSTGNPFTGTMNVFFSFWG